MTDTVTRPTGPSYTTPGDSPQRRLLDAEIQRQLREADADEKSRRAALRPWSGELGPRPMWDLHDPKTLRRIAAEMRKTAAHLTTLAATTNPR